MSDFSKKWASKLPQDYESKVDGLNTEEIEQEILNAEQSLSDTEKEMESDHKLQVLKEDLKVLNGGYRDVMKTEQAKIRFCMHTLRARGVR